MDLIQSCEDVCYVRCNSCTTILTVEIPRNRLMSETAVTIQCGHCTNTSILTTAKPQIVHQEQLYDDHYEPSLHLQTFCSEFKKGQHRDVPPSPSSSSTSSKPLSPSVVNKPPEKKRRLPSVFNLFMKDEIKRIKAANPEIPHQEAFRAAAKNWARSSTPQRICFQQQ